MNAWDNDEFRNAVKVTGRSQIIIAGILTDVCECLPHIFCFLQFVHINLLVLTQAPLSVRCRFVMLDIVSGQTTKRRAR